MILKIKYKDHPVLGDLELDFTKDGKNPYSKIVLAGENGSGKTQVLESLNDFLSLGPLWYFDYIKYEIDGKVFTISNSKNIERSLKFGFHRRTTEEDGTILDIHTNKNNNSQKVEQDKEDIRCYGVSYSSARINFSTKTVTYTTTDTLDTDKYNDDSSFDFTNIKQLFINLYYEDGANHQKFCDSNNRLPTEVEKESIMKLPRFTHAFNIFFNGLKFKDVDKNNNEFEVNFEKNGIKIIIEELSSGEKQIVYRGASLLKNSNVILGGEVLIDEPELSMHPKWQRKIYDYYCDLFKVENELKNQLIFATHSNYFLHSALNDEDALIIKLTSNGVGVDSERIEGSFTLPNITNSEIDYRIFNIYNPDFHSQLYGYFAELEKLEHLPEIDKRIIEQQEYDSEKYSKISYKNNDESKTQYLTLTTYIRNCIHHPENGNNYTDEELKLSTELLVEIIDRLNEEKEDD